MVERCAYQGIGLVRVTLNLGAHFKVEYREEETKRHASNLSVRKEQQRCSAGTCFNKSFLKKFTWEVLAFGVIPERM